MPPYDFFPELQYVDWRPKKPAPPKNALTEAVKEGVSNALISLGSMPLGGAGEGGGAAGGGQAGLGAGTRGDTPTADVSTTETDNAKDALNGLGAIASLATGNIPGFVASVTPAIATNTPIQSRMDQLRSFTDLIGLTDTVTDNLRGLPDPTDLYGFDPFGEQNTSDLNSAFGGNTTSVSIGGVDPGIEGFGGVDNGLGSSSAGNSGGIGGPAGTGGNDGPDGAGPGGSGTGGQAKGGFITMRDLHGPDPSGPDDGFTALDAGEYVIRADAVRKYGRNFLDAINRGEVALTGPGGRKGK